ncbi:MAG: hypothetical protein ACI9FN_001218 [Saprospiraceae bacterium]|jgi:hypothetical protein
MPSIVRSILILLLGLFIGGLVNYSLILLSPILIPPPEGMDPTDIASVREHFHLIGPRHYIIPFFAHALGTLVGAWVVASFVETNKIQWAMVLGAIFMIGGVTNLVSMNSPVWFTILDITIAYLPMAWLGYIWRRK